MEMLGGRFLQISSAMILLKPQSWKTMVQPLCIIQAIKRLRPLACFQLVAAWRVSMGIGGICPVADAGLLLVANAFVRYFALYQPTASNTDISLPPVVMTYILQDVYTATSNFYLECSLPGLSLCPRLSESWPLLLADDTYLIKHSNRGSGVAEVPLMSTSTPDDPGTDTDSTTPKWRTRHGWSTAPVSHRLMSPTP